LHELDVVFHFSAWREHNTRREKQMNEKPTTCQTAWKTGEKLVNAAA
jgi:hypothetical protein